MCVRVVCETHMFGGLKVDDDHLAPLAFGEEGQVSAGLDLQRGTQGQRQVGPSRQRNTTKLHYP